MRRCLGILGILAILVVVGWAYSQGRPRPAPVGGGGIPVAVYVGGGTKVDEKNVLHFFAPLKEFRVDLISGEDIRDGHLKNYRILIVPGGKVRGEAAFIGKGGLEQIKKFVQNGGQYIGICAGAYLATNDYEWSLGILNAKVLDREHASRGHGPVRISFTEQGKRILHPKADQVEIYYAGGPLLAPGTDKDLPPFQPLARFETEIAENGAPHGVMKGTVAAAASSYGKGRVLVFSPHPEHTEATQYLLRSALVWMEK